MTRTPRACVWTLRAEKRIEFGDDEIVLHLHDEGNDGRLFKMAEF
jgi:uncharacterized protein YydD (DUF2326 family)